MSSMLKDQVKMLRNQRPMTLLRTGTRAPMMLLSKSTRLPDILIWTCKIMYARMLKSQTIHLIGVGFGQIPIAPEVVEQSKILCEDYIYTRLVLGPPPVYDVEKEDEFIDNEVFDALLSVDVASENESNSVSHQNSLDIGAAVPTYSEEICHEKIEQTNYSNVESIPNQRLESQQKSVDKADEISEEEENNRRNLEESRKASLAQIQKEERMTSVSKRLQELGLVLEATDPALFVNVSHQLSMPLRSVMSIRMALICITDFMFRYSLVNWGRIVALYAIAAAIARESVDRKHPELITAIVDVVSEIIEKHAASWICRQGGWKKILKAYLPPEEMHIQWPLITFSAVVGCAATIKGIEKAAYEWQLHGF